MVTIYGKLNKMKTELRKSRDGDESGAVGVLDNEPDAHNPAGGHHLHIAVVVSQANTRIH